MTEQEIIDYSITVAKSVTKHGLTDKHKHIKGIHDLHHDACEMAESIANHAVKGKFPEKLFAHRSPNQTQKEADYIKANYKQYTLPDFIDYLSTITRPFGDGNWSIDYKEEENIFTKAGKSFQEYVEKELPIYGSLEYFMKSILPNIKSIDANGFLAVRPKDIDFIKNEANEDVVDSSEPPKPTIFYFDSKKVIDYKEGEYYLFLSTRKSVVKFNGKLEKTGNVFELYTKDSVYFINQTGDKIKNDYVIELFFSYDSEEIPVVQLKGIPVLKEDEILWQSPFIFGVDLLDCVTVNLNWLQFITNKCVFPMTVMIGSPCEFRDTDGNDCQDGQILTKEGNKHSCPNCGGVGKVGRLSALGTLLISPGTKFEDGETKTQQAPLSYIAPPVETLEFIEKKSESDRQKARQILHLRNKNSATKTEGNVTATEVFDDSKGMIAFVKPVIDQIFDIYSFLLKHIGWQRYRELAPEVELSYPKSYDFKTAEDYLNDLTFSIEKGLPTSLINTLLLQYLNAYFGDNANTTTIFKIVNNADRLFGLSQDEINMKVSRQTVAKWEDILHSSIMSFINDAIYTDPKFLEKTRDLQIKTLQDMAKSIANEISPPIIPIEQTLLP